MTTRFKDFGSGGETNKEPLAFKLHGEDFNCRPSLQGKAILDMASNSNSTDPSDISKSLYGFFEKSLESESYTRFAALLDDPNKIVTVESLGEIAGWLVEQYSGRPQQGPEQSASGQ